MKKTAIIIIGFNCADDVLACLSQLQRFAGPAFDVHICENGGAASYADLVAVIGAAHAEPVVLSAGAGADVAAIRETGRFMLGGDRDVFIHRASGNLGYAGGINAVLRWIADDPNWKSVWILNPDTKPDVAALQALQRHAEEGGYGIVGSRIILKRSGLVQMYGGRWRTWLGRGWNIGLGQPGDARPDIDEVERQLDYVCGASMYVTREFIQAVGLLDERYFLYAEEVDWCFRRGRFRLGYAHESIVYHAHGATIGSNHDRRSRSTFSVFLDERSRILFTRKFFPAMLPLVALSTFAVATQQYLPARAYRNYAAAIAGWFDGLRGRTGFPSRFLPPQARATLEQRDEMHETSVTAPQPEIVAR